MKRPIYTCEENRCKRCVHLADSIALVVAQNEFSKVHTVFENGWMDTSAWEIKDADVLDRWKSAFSFPSHPPKLILCAVLLDVRASVNAKLESRRVEK